MEPHDQLPHDHMTSQVQDQTTATVRGRFMKIMGDRLEGKVTHPMGKGEHFIFIFQLSSCHAARGDGKVGVLGHHTPCSRMGYQKFHSPHGMKPRIFPLTARKLIDIGACSYSTGLHYSTTYLHYSTTYLLLICYYQFAYETFF